MQLHHNGRKVWTWTALLAVVGCVTAAGISMRIPNRYRSVAVIELIGGVEEKKLSAVLQKVFAAERLQPLIDKHRLYSREQASDQVQTVLTKITRDISMGRVAHLQGGRKAFSISFEYDDPHAAQSVVRELTQAFREEHAQANAGGGGTLSMLDAPSLPLAPYYPSRRNIAFVGLLAGAAVGVLCAAVQLRMCGLSSR